MFQIPREEAMGFSWVNKCVLLENREKASQMVAAAQIEVNKIGNRGFIGFRFSESYTPFKPLKYPE
jgi:hypothetical protein